jgi:cellobiose epimerase
MRNHLSGKSSGFIYRVMAITLLAFGVKACSSEPESETQSHVIEDEMKLMLDAWYPRVIDEEHGGYISSFSHDWEMTGTQEKMIVTQARHLWSLSKVMTLYPDNQDYPEYANQGFEFLKKHMWDDEYGGFYQMVTREGEPMRDTYFGDNYAKTLYGNSFAIYGLAAHYGATGNQGSLDLAVEAFNWLEEHSHDKEYGGYFQPLARDGTPTTEGYTKDYNSGIHILEALTELYAVWPDDLVRERLDEMFHVVRDIMVSEQGYLKLYFAEDWTHLSYQDSTEAEIRENMGRDHVTPGHDIETSFLLLEAAHELGTENDPETQRIAKLLTDHTLDTGWDSEAGGFYNTGYYFPGDDELTIVNDGKTWWAQAEGLNTLLIMADMYPDDPHDYLAKFEQQWEYINEYLIDHEHGGWYNSGLDMDPESVNSRKSQIWKGNYHTLRAMIRVLERLEAQG